MWADALLIHPVLEAGATGRVAYFPLQRGAQSAKGVQNGGDLTFTTVGKDGRSTKVGKNVPFEKAGKDGPSTKVNKNIPFEKAGKNVPFAKKGGESAYAKKEMGSRFSKKGKSVGQFAEEESNIRVAHSAGVVHHTNAVGTLVWYDIYTGRRVDVGRCGDPGCWVWLDAPISHLPVHVRGGVVIPMQLPAVNTYLAYAFPKSPFDSHRAFPFK